MGHLIRWVCPKGGQSTQADGFIVRLLTLEGVKKWSLSALERYRAAISKVQKVTANEDSSSDPYYRIPNNHTCMFINFVEYCPGYSVLVMSVCYTIFVLYIYIPPNALFIVQSKIPPCAIFSAWAIFR